MTTTCTAFAGFTRLASGDLATVARTVKAHTESHPTDTVLIFDDATSQPVELDLRGSLDDVLARLAPPAPTAAPVGRPKLGVVAKEVTLLPRHWEWLATQPGGASVALRKLVEEARKASAWEDALRQQQETTYRFISAIGGNLPGFEEVSRALFANDREGFATRMEGWPEDVRAHALTLLSAPV